jgi:hypothetical protein
MIDEMSLLKEREGPLRNVSVERERETFATSFKFAIHLLSTR